MKAHGKMNAQLLSPEYWQKAKLPKAEEFARKFQAIDSLPDKERSAAIETLLVDMAKAGYNSPVNPAWSLYSAVLVQRK